MKKGKPTTRSGKHASPTLDRAATSASTPISARLAHEIVKPKDWQAFQRNCAVLFQAELRDPNAQEYGRSGQKQGGIDVLGRRDGNPDHYVGVQCRLITKPLTESAIMVECRAALELKANLKEIIFATTAPDDTSATDAAIAVERALRTEGHDLAVVVYGWGALQTKIAIHDTAYAAFCPSIVATSAPQTPLTETSPDNILAAQVAAQVVAQFGQAGIVFSAREGDGGSNAEDPALHAQIDTYRDLITIQKQPQLAENGLLALLEKAPIEGKPWARFRIETNLGAVALQLGREAEAAKRYEAAHSVRPDDPKALANLALARTIQGQHEEAMALARKALAAAPSADHAVGYLLQAAARSSWQGEPESLIPPDLVGSTHADLGLVEFLRKREIPGWAHRSVEISRRHADVDEFKRIGALAVLALATETEAFLPGGKISVTREELNEAATDMKAVANHYLEIGFADEHDLAAALNNAAMLLRLSGRHNECEDLLKRGLPKVPNEPALKRLLALEQAADGRRAEALATLAAAGDDPESLLLGSELLAIDDPNAALKNTLAMDTTKLNIRLGSLRWRLIGELALRTKDIKTLEAAIGGLRALDAKDVFADLLEVRKEQLTGLDSSGVQRRLAAIAAALPPDADMVSRCFVAEELMGSDLAEEAWPILEGHVDFSRHSPAAALYLQSLVIARRDDKFQTALEGAAAELRDHPETLWMVAAHAWNIGDLDQAARTVEALLAQQPENPRARLLKIEILIRRDQSTELLAELDKPIEDLAWSRLRDQFRIASLLGGFGYLERAATLAYRLFLEHRDNSRAWMTLSIIVLKEGQGEEDTPRIWGAPVVAPNVAVDLRYEDGEEVFLVVEPDAGLRKLDDESWEPDHPLVKSLIGLAVGDRFTGPTGRKGVIAQLRHKYVARFHYILHNHEARFPMIAGFRKVAVDAEQPGGLDNLIAELTARRDWIRAEEEHYSNGPWPIGVLAHRLGLDVIEVASGLASEGVPLKVAVGAEPEREAAITAIRANAQKGCVLDLLAFWTAWKLQALGAIIEICGPIQLTQSVLDRLRARRDRFDGFAKDGFQAMRYEAGKIVTQEVTPAMVAAERDDVDSAIAWAEAHTTIRPLMAGEELPPELRDYLRTRQSDIFDSIILAMQAGVLLVSDDLPTREISRSIGGNTGAWLHQVFSVALDRKQIDLETHVRWSANLIDAGHNYIGISGRALASGLRMDANTGQAPGHLFTTLSKVIGGKIADAPSHISACVGCLGDLWSDHATVDYRQPATGLLLRQLLRERFDDYGKILRALVYQLRHQPRLVQYIYDWARGHFIMDALTGSDGRR